MIEELPRRAAATVNLTKEDKAILFDVMGRDSDSWYTLAAMMAGDRSDGEQMFARVDEQPRLAPTDELAARRAAR